MTKLIEQKRARLQALMSKREDNIKEILDSIVKRIVRVNAFSKSVINSDDESKIDDALFEQKDLDKFLEETFRSVKK